MTVVLIIVAAVIVSAGIGIYAAWPNRLAMNVIRSARQRKLQRSVNDLSVGELTQRALAGDSAAQYRLGYLHATGDGVAVDYAKSNHWFERAVQAGVIDALYCLGLHYERGRGANIDYHKALELYRKAADAGSADAQCNLGMMYLRGNGVGANATKAAWWFVLSKAQGNETASQNLEWLVENSGRLSAPELAESREIEFMANRGDVDALLVLGWMYSTGFAYQRDTITARRLYERAQARGHIFAHVLIGQLTL